MNQSIEWVDSHCHLEMLKSDTEKALEESVRQGMKLCITIGTNHEANQKIQRHCRKFDRVFGTYGIHPHGASKFKQEHLEWIESEILKDAKIVGIGECGFDFFYKYSEEADQREAFAAQLGLAAELELPIVIHSRAAEQQTRDVLESFKGKGLSGVVHCFTSSLDQAKYMLDAGFYLSFNGICTYPQANPVREVLNYTPKDRILLETDAPFLSPVPFRGKPNTPGNVSIVGEFVAGFLNIPVERFAEMILQNTLTLFSGISL